MKGVSIAFLFYVVAVIGVLGQEASKDRPMASTMSPEMNSTVSQPGDTRINTETSSTGQTETSPEAKPEPEPEPTAEEGHYSMGGSKDHEQNSEPKPEPEPEPEPKPEVQGHSDHVALHPQTESENGHSKVPQTSKQGDSGSASLMALPALLASMFISLKIVRL